MSHLNLDLYLTFCVKKKNALKRLFLCCFSRLCHIFKCVVYSLFNDSMIVEENVSPVDHKANNHYYKVYTTEALLPTFINPFKCEN